MVDNADKPAAPVSQATETFSHPIRQLPGLSKRELAAIASLGGQRAQGSELSSKDIALVAWEDADALFAAEPGGDA